MSRSNFPDDFAGRLPGEELFQCPNCNSELDPLDMNDREDCPLCGANLETGKLHHDDDVVEFDEET